jgi:hypothetical protein
LPLGFAERSGLKLQAVSDARDGAGTPKALTGVRSPPLR